MHINYFYTHIGGLLMALQIANPTVVNKIQALARLKGISKTAAVENAVDKMVKIHTGNRNR
jgi:antitoxin VapB